MIYEGENRKTGLKELIFQTSLFLIFCDRCKLFSFTKTYYTQVPLICQVISFTDRKNISLFFIYFL
ncbi:MAG: hypothetical protein DBY45_00825 [Clostridiales bacterium]|nr:MAG: hypothetical protein DBY45_00825 [Clostridiales bacterium]